MRRPINRRELLKGFGLGLAGATLGVKPFLLAGCSSQSSQVQSVTGKRPLYKKPVALVKGNDRRDIVYQSLKMIEDDVIGSIGSRQILIKPNMVVTGNPLAATHPDAVRAILDFLKPHYKKQILIGESSAFGHTFDGFANYGYTPLEKEYNAKLLDLNQQPWQYRYVFAEGNQPISVRIISTFLDPNVYIISAARMKTHDRVVVTLSLKNVLLGAPVSDDSGNDKFNVHTGPIAVDTILHYNMFQLAREIYPDLAVIDGFEAMEGDGPTRGTPFDARVAVASADPLAADTVATTIMGFDPQRIRYLAFMNEAGMGQGDLDKIVLLGTPLDQCRYKLKPNHRMAELYNF